jgi:glycosyltransferase involved in cell wall biosynthesis
MKKHFISIMTPCFNEEGNVEELHRQISKVMEPLHEYDYEHIYIDNASTDRTQELLRKIAAEDKRVKVIINTRNFGHIRSPHHAFLQAQGEAVISMVSDLQDPPEMICEYLKKWREGYKIVLGQKVGSEENSLMFRIRKIYYAIVSKFSDVELLQNVTGAGLYDREVVEKLRSLDDPYPYVRGLISELGYSVARIPFHQPNRKNGITKNNWYTLYDMAMLGFTSHSKIPLRLAAIFGFFCAFLSILVALAYLIYKLLHWDRFPLGAAPLVIGLFFFTSVQLFFIGIIGEYIGAIHTQVMKRPLVVEKERINF